MKRFFEKIKKNLDTIWIVTYVATLFILIIMGGNRWGLECLAKAAEVKDYYINFLWPTIYPYVAAGLGIITLAAGFVYSECLMDENARNKSKDELVIKNIAHVVTIISNVGFIAVNLICLKCVGWLLIYLAAMAIFAGLCFGLNIKDYRESNDSKNIENIWAPGALRLSIIMLAIIGGVLILGGGLVQGIDTAKTNFKKMNGYKVELSYGHLLGFEDNRAIAKLEFVNMYGSSGREYSFEQLEQEYANFKSGKGSWSNLWLFCEESINIELKSQHIDIDYGYYPYYETYGELGEYYFPDVIKQDDEYYRNVNDKLLDVKFFCVCVEHDLNSKGLTLSQVNDSFYAASEETHLQKRDYITATPEQVREACRNYANLREPLAGSESQLENIDNLELTFNVGIGSRLCDLKIELDDGFTVSNIKWLYEASYDNMDECDGNTRVKRGVVYAAVFEVEIPYIYRIDDNIKATVNGIQCSYVEIVKNKNGENKVDMKLMFTATEENGAIVNGLEIGLVYISPEKMTTGCKASDESTLCDGEYVGWQVYDRATGTASDYTAETFSEDNLCYIAIVEVTPDDDTSFKNVELLFLGNTINIYEYDEDIHKYQPGEYPKAYFVKSEEDGEEKILAYIPYYMAQTTGVEGDLQNTYNDGNYVYLPEGANMKFKDRPKFEYKIDEYKVTDYEGNPVDTKINLMESKGMIMPSHPVIVTGYYEPKF